MVLSLSHKIGWVHVYIWTEIFLWFECSYFSIYLKSLYESYLPLSALLLIPFFNHLVRNPLSSSTATITAPVISDSSQSLFVFRYVAILIRLRCYIVFINLFLLSIVSSNVVFTGFATNTANKISLYFVLGGKLCLLFNCFNWFDLHKVIVWVFINMIYVIYNLIFQTSYSKPYLCYHYYNCLSIYKWQQWIPVCFVPCIATLIR